MTGEREPLQDPSDWIHGIAHRVEELAMQGDVYGSGMYRAFYKSTDPDVSYVETRHWPDTPQSVSSGLLINFKDGRYFNMTFSEGSIWTLDYSVFNTPAADDPEHTIPYSAGRSWTDYVSRREHSPAAEAQGLLNFRNILTTGHEGVPFVDEAEVDDFISAVMKRMNETADDPFVEELSSEMKAIDPADLDLHQMFQQIRHIDPLADAIDQEALFSEKIEPQDYEYMRRESKRISKVLSRLHRIGKSDASIVAYSMREIEYVNRLSPHIGKHLAVYSSQIWRLGAGEESEPAMAARVNGILLTFIYSDWIDEETGEDYEGLALMIKLEHPYDRDEFPNNENSPFNEPVAFVPVASIAELREYRSLP